MWDISTSSNKSNRSGAPLHLAVEYSSVDHIKSLLGHGADARSIDNQGRAALHRIAGRMCSFEAEKIPIEAGIDIRSTDSHGNTAFHIGVATCHTHSPENENMMDVMIDFGHPVDYLKSPSSASAGSVTALQLACGNGSLGSVLKLLKRGADVNHSDRNGRTALHWLAEKARYLLRSRIVQIALTIMRRMDKSAILAQDKDGLSAAIIAMKVVNENKQPIDGILASWASEHKRHYENYMILSGTSIIWWRGIYRQSSSTISNYMPLP